MRIEALQPTEHEIRIVADGGAARLFIDGEEVKWFESISAVWHGSREAELYIIYPRTTAEGVFITTDGWMEFRQLRAIPTGTYTGKFVVRANLDDASQPRRAKIRSETATLSKVHHDET